MSTSCETVAITYVHTLCLTHSITEMATDCSRPLPTAHCEHLLPSNAREWGVHVILWVSDSGGKSRAHAKGILRAVFNRITLIMRFLSGSRAVHLRVRAER